MLKAKTKKCCPGVVKMVVFKGKMELKPSKLTHASLIRTQCCRYQMKSCNNDRATCHVHSQIPL